MKLIFAGPSSVQTLNYANYVYNCTRNAKCQKRYDVPIRNWSDVVLYADLQFGEPETYEIEILDACSASVYAVVSTDYIIGQKPDLSYYGVFGNMVPVFALGESVRCFILRFTFTKASVEYIYYTEQFCFEQCDGLMYMQGCYPNEPRGSEAEDCNGIYYGLHSGPTAPLGTPNYRYFHWAYVRLGNIIEQKKKLSFTAFNNKTIYSTKQTAEYLLQFERVPTFYQRVISGVIGIGNIKVDGVGWKLADEQEFQIADLDSQFWNMDILLDEQCDMAFGCGPRDCELPDISCCTPEVTLATATNPVSARITNINSTLSITAIYTISGPPYLPGDTRLMTVTGGYPIGPNQFRDAAVHADHDGLSNLIVVVYFSGVPCFAINLKVIDSDAVSQCPGFQNCLVPIIQTTTNQRLANAETWSIRLSADAC
jgi:hypothetical protein